MNKDVEKIRAEVERRYNYHKDHADDWAGTCNFWSAHEDREILSFIDSMQKEPEFKVGDTLRRKSDGCHAKVIEVRNGNVRVESADWDMWILNKEWELVEEPETSVWHDNKDTPVASKTKIVLYTNGKWDLFKAYKSDNDFDNYWASVNQSLEEKGVLVKHWAYVDDLLTLSNLETTEKERKCMYSKDDYTDEDRKVLCDGCEEECKYSKSDDFTKALAECISQAQGSVVDPMVFAELWKDELIKLAKREEPVSEELKNIELLHELKESDGEKARKEIIAILKYKYEKYPKNPRYSNAPQLIAWLDKQGEPVSEDLGEAADNCYYRNHAHARESFIEGAKWDEQQKAKDAIDCEISEVEVDTCGCGLNSHTRLSIVVDDEELRNMGFKDGDKCKVVILKDTPEYIEGVKGSYTTTTK